MELASARAPPALRLPVALPRLDRAAGDVKGPEAWVMSALARHLEGKQDAARQKLKAAMNNDGLPRTCCSCGRTST